MSIDMSMFKGEIHEIIGYDEETGEPNAFRYKSEEPEKIRDITQEAFVDRFGIKALTKLEASAEASVKALKTFLLSKKKINLDSDTLKDALELLRAESIIDGIDEQRILADGTEDEAA